MVLTCVTTQGPASMIVQAVCLPEGSKTLVIPIFFPIIPFIVLQFMPAELLGHAAVSFFTNHSGSLLANLGVNPRLLPTFSFSHRSFSEGDPCDRLEARHQIQMPT